MEIPATLRAAGHAALVVVVAATLGGCVLSLDPFYGESAVVAVPVADGKWQRLDGDGEPEKGDVWLFEGRRITSMDERGRWHAFDVTYFQVNGVTFMDSLPVPLQGDPTPGEGYWRFHHEAFHMVSRVAVDGDRLRLRPLTFKAFNEVTADAPARSGIVRRDYATLVFDADAGDWARFLDKHGRDDAVFTPKSEIVFIRR